jgi:glycosyltransferase involved in cell wall biosynthesis
MTDLRIDTEPRLAADAPSGHGVAAGWKMGFVSQGDPSDITGWSGIMTRALAGAGCQIVPIHGFKRTFSMGAWANKCWAKGVLRRYYEIERHPAVLRHYARQIEARTAARELAAVFSTGTHLTADCRTKAPLFFWADATVPALFALYPGYGNFSKTAYREALESERRAVRNATAMFFSSAWAAKSAVQDLQADPAKVHVVSFGANLEEEPAADAALALAEARPRSRLVLLFAGVLWQRKGGAKALAIAQALAAAGVPVELHLLGVDRSAVGHDPVPGGKNLAVHWHGRVSKATGAGRDKIAGLFAGAHFLLLPTVGDCTPMVFAEANAFAVPVATHRLGGIPSMISDGVNGRMFAPDSPPSEQAAWLARVWQDQAGYLALARGARAEYDARLNWRKAATGVLDVVRRNIGRQ